MCILTVSSLLSCKNVEFKTSAQSWYQTFTQGEMQSSQRMGCQPIVLSMIPVRPHMGSLDIVQEMRTFDTVIKILTAKSHEITQKSHEITQISVMHIICSENSLLSYPDVETVREDKEFHILHENLIKGSDFSTASPVAYRGGRPIWASRTAKLFGRILDIFQASRTAEDPQAHLRVPRRAHSTNT
ncbi:hypothetical protein E3N88_43786 [Mikania micrantha]|uniref:Uncharacterized protein n=1 Tax=Mikania micrantha TaxID=192012 RepID=A0A5N6LDY3_9ASTR|nr:hypothetical protein E3N88_43786 [Mikania micrantha]